MTEVRDPGFSCRFAVYRAHRSDPLVEEFVLGGFASSSEAMDEANRLQRLDPRYRYLVGEE